MGERKRDSFRRIDSAIDKIREEVDEVAEESKELGGKATAEVREAIDELEGKVRDLRSEDE